MGFSRRSLLVGSAILALITSVSMGQEAIEVGISMPTLANARWINDGNNIVKSLEDMGHSSELVVADDATCKSLMDTMIAEKPELWAEDIGEEA